MLRENMFLFALCFFIVFAGLAGLSCLGHATEAKRENPALVRAHRRSYMVFADWSKIRLSCLLSAYRGTSAIILFRGETS